LKETLATESARALASDVLIPRGFPSIGFGLRGEWPSLTAG
jgi:hypothetical protein